MEKLNQLKKYKTKITRDSKGSRTLNHQIDEVQLKNNKQSKIELYPLLQNTLNNIEVKMEKPA